MRVVGHDTIVSTRQGHGRVATVEVHDVFVRGERTRLRVETVAVPKALLVLFAGGKGVTGAAEDGELRGMKGNFLIRSRTLFLNEGFSIAVIDAPTDRPYDLRYGFRGSAAHATDIGAAIVHLRRRYGVPVWLIGTSRGTNSVANAASRLRRDMADGIVLTASMLVENGNGNQVFDFALGEIVMPVLVLHHEDDGCRVTPAHEVDRLRRNLTGARPLAVRLYRGGRKGGASCGASSHHGFLGIENEVVADIADWIESPVAR